MRLWLLLLLVAVLHLATSYPAEGEPDETDVSDISNELQVNPEGPVGRRGSKQKSNKSRKPITAIKTKTTTKPTTTKPTTTIKPKRTNKSKTNNKPTTTTIKPTTTIRPKRTNKSKTNDKPITTNKQIRPTQGKAKPKDLNNKENRARVSALNQKPVPQENKTSRKAWLKKETKSIKTKLDSFKTKLASLNLKNITAELLAEIKPKCTCEDKVCECCARIPVKVCFTALYQRVQEKSTVTLKLALRIGQEVPLYTRVLQFNRKAPACKDVDFVGRVCIKAVKTQINTNSESSFDAEIDIKVLFDKFALGAELELVWEQGTLQSKSIKLIEHVPKVHEPLEESKEAKGNNKISNRVPLRVPDKYKYKIILNDPEKKEKLKTPDHFKGLFNNLKKAISKARDGECECIGGECECRVILKKYKACITATYTPPAEKTDDGDDDDAVDDDDDDNNNDGKAKATMTIVGSLQNTESEDDGDDLPSVSYTAIGNTGDELECEPSSRYGNICLQINSVYLEDEDETKGVCVAFVMNEYKFGFKKCIAVDDEDGSLIIGDPDESSE